MGQKAFYFRGPREWNGLPDNIKNTKDIDSLKWTLFINIFLMKYFTRDDVVSQRLKFGSAFLSFSWESKIALFF